MKKAKKLKLALMLLPMAALTFTACSDDTNDTPDTPSTPEVKWDIDDYMDTSVKPGDDFARYCWGKWYDNAGVPDTKALGCLPEGEVATDEKVAKLENKEMKQLESDIAKFKTYDEGYEREGYDELFAHMVKLRDQLDNPDALEIAKLLGAFYASGRNCMIKCDFTSRGEKNYFYVDVDTTYISDIMPIKILFSKDELTGWCKDLGLGKYAKELLDNMMSVNLDADGDASSQSDKYSVDQIKQAFCQSFGISADHLLNGDNLASAILQSRRMVLATMIWSLVSDDALVVSESLGEMFDSYLCNDPKKFVSMIFTDNKLLDYPRSKEYCEKYCTEEQRTKVLNLMEDLRTTFAQRIDNLDWMSNTTKQAAKKKLAAIECHALYPDKWYEAGLPQLEGKSLYFDVNIIRQARINLQKELLSVNPRKDLLNTVFASLRPAYTLNCSYAPLVNCVCIFAPMVSEPIYSLSDPEAKLYAAGTSIGHELTHAFDSSGALYGPLGEDANWWTVSDKQDFDKRTKLLVDCYNHLPGYQDCATTIFADGTKTLDENIADIGGLELALQAYTSKLEQQGVQGDELVKSQKRFFQAYANYWRYKNTPANNAELLKTDVHANAYTRILGATMNCNRWYEVYDVQWGDKYYLHPENRTHIW